MPPRRTSRLPATLTVRIDVKTRKLLQHIAGTRHMSESALALHFITEGLGRHDVLYRLDEVERRLLIVEALVTSDRGQEPASHEEAPSNPDGN